MFNFNLSSFYSLACALLPCIAVLLGRRRAGTRVQRLWVLLFCLYLWQVYDLTGAGGVSDILIQLRIFDDLNIHSLSSLLAALHAPNGPDVFRSTVNLVPQFHLSVGFLLNIAMLVPLGVLLPLLWRDCRSLIRIGCMGAAFSLLIEGSQLLTSRTCDINDLIANILGAMLGFCCWWFCAQLFGKYLRQTPTGVKEPLLLIAASFSGMFFFYHPFWFYSLVGH